MMHRRVLLWLLALGLVVAARSEARDGVLIPFERDHLKCYQIKDQAPEAKFRVALENQFGVEKRCRLKTPARLLCAETAKLEVEPQPHGGGPGGVPAGHFLCYQADCKDSASAKVEVEDQFGRRMIELERTRLLCAPTNKLVCGDGDLDPGEECDPPGSLTCPDVAGTVGLPCGRDCLCPRPCGPVPTAPECSGACPEGEICRDLTLGNHLNNTQFNEHPLCECVPIVGEPG